MNKQIFLNIAVADLPKATAFYQALGYSLHPEFTGDGAACRHQRDDLRHARHACQVPRIHPKAVCDTTQAVEVLFNLSCESRQEVDDLVARAVAAGGSTYDKAEDFGFMYTHSFVDPDGHGWGLFHMSAPPPNA